MKTKVLVVLLLTFFVFVNAYFNTMNTNKITYNLAYWAYDD